MIVCDAKSQILSNCATIPSMEKTPSYRYIYNEYKEGLMLFDLMQNEVWNKAKEDTLGLKNYYNKNKKLINNSEIIFDLNKEISAEVISKYQVLFEKQWIKSLREKKVIFVDKKVLKKIKKYITK